LRVPATSGCIIEEIRGDDPGVAAELRIDEQELEGVGALN
jgi:hypothetical protein